MPQLPGLATRSASSAAGSAEIRGQNMDAWDAAPALACRCICDHHQAFKPPYLGAGLGLLKHNLASIGVSFLKPPLLEHKS